MVAGTPKIANFPVKFPVSREFPRRRVRSALRRQPGSLRFREFPSLDEKGPPSGGFSHRHESLETDVRTFLAKNSQKSPAGDLRLAEVCFWPRLCENALGRRMRRIVFSIAFFRKKLPVQSTPISTKSRWKFYTQVGHRCFHTAWTLNGRRPAIMSRCMV
jgi:hypothetical protein